MTHIIELLKKIKNITGFLNILIFIILFFIIWFIAPHIKIDHHYPFKNVIAKFYLLFIVFIASTLKYTVYFLQKHQVKSFAVIKQVLVASRQKIFIYSKSFFKHSRTSMANLKTKAVADRQKKQLNRLPWYLVLGTPHVGKKTIMAHFDLYYAKAEHFGSEAVKYVHQFPDIDWWFSEQAILLDVMSADSARDMPTWKKLIKLLKKERHNKPLNGIILNFAFTELLTYSNQKRQDFIHDVCQYIRDIYDQFKAQVPVYIIFNKVDLIEGFAEYFNHLSKEDLQQIWGMSFPLNQCTDLQWVLRFFDEQYQQIINRLRKGVIWSLDAERNTRGRELIHSFPQQMQLFKKPLEDFIKEIFAATRYHHALQLRGIYFVSSKQEGESTDFLLHAMTKKFQLVPPKFKRPERIGECYFLRRLFLDVILLEAPILGDSEKTKKIRQFAYQSSRIALPFIVLLLVYNLYQAYQENKTDLKQLKLDLKNYQFAYSKIQQNDVSLSQLIPLFDQIDQARLIYKKPNQLAAKLLFSSDMLHDSVEKIELEALNNLFMPRVAAELESKLNQNINDQNLLYATFKAYLAFDANDQSTANAITAPMEYNWNSIYQKNPEINHKLRHYLQLAISRSAPKLPLDQTLIERIRTELAEINPVQRAYGLLVIRASASNLAPLVLKNAVGNDFDQLFSLENQTTTIIPALYTQFGFKNIFLKKYKQIASEVAADNEAVGISDDSDSTLSQSQIEVAMRVLYQKNYIDAWQTALHNIKIHHFKNITTAIQVFNQLIRQRSALAKLLAVVDDNTSGVTAKDIEVAKHFKALNNFERSTAKKSTWQETTKDLIAVRDYLLAIENAKNKNRAAYLAVLQVMQGKKNLLEILTTAVNQVPVPARRFLLTITNNAWGVVIAAAHQYLNAKWRQNILPFYQANLANRFPLDEHARSEVTINHFNQFFAENGLLQQFYHQYLKPFINTEKNHWKLYVVNGHDLELSKGSIALFQRISQIRQSFFSDHANLAKISFAMKPLTLDANASRISLNIGGRVLMYQHGPQNWLNLSWPLAANSQYVHAVIFSFNGYQYRFDASGGWALFKLLNAGRLARTNDSGRYIYYLDIDGYHASFEFAGSSDIGLFNLTNLLGLKLPKKIA